MDSVYGVIGEFGCVHDSVVPDSLLVVVNSDGVIGLPLIDVQSAVTLPARYYRVIGRGDLLPIWF